MRPAAALAALLIFNASASTRLITSVADQKCAKFEVACKAERDITPAQQAQGVTAQVVAMITFDGFDTNFKQAQSGAKAAEFTKTAKGWTRADHGPVYMQNCGDMK